MAEINSERLRVLEIAQGEIGKQDPTKYWEEVLPLSDRGKGFRGAWCGGFALWCLKQAGLAPNLDWAIGRGFCYRLRATNAPKPGDVAYIDQPYQHHALVVEVMGDRVHTIDGNQLGSTVKATDRPRSKITAFYSIESLLTPEPSPDRGGATGELSA